jgi:hypothetical protein
MQFRSRDGGIKRVTLEDGRVALIGPEWREIPEGMENAAYAAGCLSDETLADIKPVPAALTVETVKQAMKAIIEGNDPAYFAKDGTINRSVLNARVGAVVDKGMAKQAWAELQAEAGE